MSGTHRPAGGRCQWQLARLVLVSALAVLAVVAGCGSSSEDAVSDADVQGTTGSLSGEITVSAAASLTDAFTDVADAFLRDRPAADITFNFDSSGSLATQIREGAPADVVALADTAPMDELERADLLATAPTVFARNELVLVTRPGNPTGIAELSDLTSGGVVSLCVETAPCGRYAAQILAAADVAIPASSITRGTDVRATLRAVAEGDAVAAIVYATDARSAADRVDTLALPTADQPIADYPIAVVAATSNAELAEAFTAYVLSDAGRAVLEAAGFLAP